MAYKCVSEKLVLFIVLFIYELGPVCTHNHTVCYCAAVASICIDVALGAEPIVGRNDSKGRVETVSMIAFSTTSSAIFVST